MKRLLTLVLPLMLLFTACEKKEYVTPNQTVVLDISSASWFRNTNGTCTRTIDLPELDYYYQDRGAVLVYASFDNGRNYEQIPEVYDGISYSFVAREGELQIDLQPASGSAVVTPPSVMTVKIVLVDSDY